MGMGEPLANYDTTWAAVAYSMSTNVKGFSWGYPIGSGPDSAVAQRALQECANHPLRPADCRWFNSARCVAIAESPEYVQGGGGLTREDAESDAKTLPRGSEVPASPPMMFSVCSEPGDAPGGASRLE